jgi:PAS domain S-box-containing protein
MIAISSVRDVIGDLRAWWDKLTAPCATDAYDARREYATKVVLGILTLLFVLISPLSFLARRVAPNEVTPEMPIVIGLVALVFGCSWWLAYRGYWRMSSYVPPFVMFLIAISGTYTYGLGATNITKYTVAILLTILLQDERAWWGALILSLVTGLALEWRNIRRHPTMGMDDLVYWLVVLGAFYTIVVLLLKFLVDQFREALAQSRALTAELKAEIAERERVERALRESEELLHHVFDTSPNCIFVKNRDGVYLMANEAIAALYGTTPEAMIGKTDLDFADQLALKPEEAADFVADDREVIDAKRTRVIPEEPFTRPDGTTRWFQTVKTSLALPDDPDCMLGIALDVTELKRTEDRLQRHERLAAVGQLAAGIAHDFRNLLTTIILYAEMPLRRSDLPSDVTQSLETILDEARKATDLVQQILDFSSRAMIKPRPLDVVELVEGVLAVLRRTLPETIHLALEADDAPYVVSADPGRIEQALTNLAINARDAMPDGGHLRFALSRVTTSPDERPPLADMPPGEWVQIAVSDTGTGMTEEVQAHLFEPFFTTKEEGAGTGLGLAQVYGIVRQHGGYIDVETALGEGTTFHIYLPACEERETREADDEQSIPAGQGERILLVEDNQNLLGAGRSILESMGYRVVTASNGHEALEKYEAEPAIDLVITDLVMPQMGGKTLVRTLKRRDGDLKALGLTGYAVDETGEEHVPSDFLDVIHKPFEVEDLAQAIREALES